MLATHDIFCWMRTFVMLVTPIRTHAVQILQRILKILCYK